MGRRGGEQGGPSTHVFVRPVTMLAVGLASGLAMWWVLTAGDAPPGSAGARLPAEQAQVWAAAAERAAGGQR
jgi:hypothetical protein